MLRATAFALALLIGSAATGRPSSAADQAGPASLAPLTPDAAVAAAHAEVARANAAPQSRCLAGLKLRGPAASMPLAQGASRSDAGVAGADAPASILDPHPGAAPADVATPGEPAQAAAEPAAEAPAVADAEAARGAAGASGEHPGAAAADDDAGEAEAAGDATASDTQAEGEDELGAASRRRAFPLPLPRPADAVMRVALRRELRPGMAVPDEAALPATRIGQMLMVGFEGDDVDDPGPRRLAAHIKAGDVGGVLFFKRNIAGEAAIRRLTAMFSAAAAGSPTRLPVLLAVDQEGGLVQRLDRKIGFVDTPSAVVVAAEGDAAATATYVALADNLAAWGFNLNLGPVVDLGFNEKNPVVTKLDRAYAPDAETVTRFARLFIAAHRAAGVLTAVKHFPGHGSSNGDTHDGFVDVTDSFRPEEMVPFERLIEENEADMVMVAHVENGELDPVTRPASLSPVVIEHVLRENCGFAGVVISDDLEMGAIRALGTPIDVTRDAILAGNDILVYGSGQSRSGDLIAVLHARIRIAAKDPAVARRIGESFDRIARLKETLARRVLASP